MAIEFNSAANLGISSNTPNMNVLLDKLVAKELARLQPMQELQDVYKGRFDAWQQAKSLLEAVALAAEPIIDRLTWSSKIATSSDPEIVTATADTTAVPGKYPLIVDRVASYHQIGSQRYSKEDTVIGTGVFEIGLLDERPLKIEISPPNNTLEYLVDAINEAKIDVSAKIVKLGKDDFPYQMILTSKQSGEEGRIIVNDNLQGGEAPDFRYRHTQPSPWYFAPRELNKDTADTTGASSTVPIFSGTYTGNRDIEITFTALNTGKVGGDDQPIVGWRDNFGRSGQLKLGKFDYADLTELDVVDGIKVKFSEGDIVINDSFTFKAKPDESNFWWVPDDEKAAINYPPTPWSKHNTTGLPTISGEFQSERDDKYTLTVRQGGIIGVSNHVYIDYSSENGEQGTVDVGLDYKVGEPVSLGKGLTLTLDKGVLQTGFETSFEVEAPLSNDYWWLFGDGEPDKPTSFNKPLSWANNDAVNLTEDDLYDPNSRRSQAEKRVVGQYRLDENKTYTVKVRGNGTVGVSDGIYLEWSDGKGKSGTLEVGRGYTPGSSLRIEGGLSLQIDSGYIFNDDYFTFDAISPTIVPPQDSQIRLNPLDNKQGGLIFTSSTNIIKDAIEGVTLELYKAEDKVVIITIEEDKKKAKEAIEAFVKAYNEALMYIKEAIKYDPETNIAGPLQAEYHLADIQDALRTFIVDAVPGLPRDANTLPFAGISLKKDGTLEFDVDKLDERLASDYKKVADIFRNFGTIDSNRVIFINSTAETKNSGDKGYDVNITQAATKGSFVTQAIDFPMNVVDGQNKFTITINGKTSDVITLETGDWTLRQIGKQIAKEIRRDKLLSNTEFTSVVENKQLTITSGLYGSESNVLLTPVDNAQLPFLTGDATNGVNVEGTINNHPAIGRGRLLSANDDYPEKGLRLLVAMKQGQLSATEPEANVVYTEGKGGIVKKYLDIQLKEKTGTVDTGIKKVSDRIDDLDERLTRGAERVERKKERLSRQFASVEERLSRLSSIKQNLSNQFQTLGG